MRTLTFALAVVAALVSHSSQSRADSDTLLPVTFASFADDFKKAASKAGVHDRLAKVNCLDGGRDKRTVCTYRFGDFMQIMAETKAGDKDIVGLTLICTAGENYADNAKCLLSYAAAMIMTAPEMDGATRAKIVKTLLSGLEVGNRTAITTDERRYTLQRSIGLWFHIYAADVEQS